MSTRGGPGRDDEEVRDAGRPALRPSQVRAADEAARQAAGTGPGADARADEPTTPAAWRVLFAYRGEQVRVVSCRRVRTMAPPDDSALLESGSRGSWAEVRDAQGGVLYVQVLHQPVRARHEVHNRYGTTPRQVEAEVVEGAFDVVVPDLPGGVELVVRGRADVVEAARRAPKQLVKVRLEERTG